VALAAVCGTASFLMQRLMNLAVTHAVAASSESRQNCIPLQRSFLNQQLEPGRGSTFIQNTIVVAFIRLILHRIIHKLNQLHWLPAWPRIQNNPCLLMYREWTVGHGNALSTCSDPPLLLRLLLTKVVVVGGRHLPSIIHQDNASKRVFC
jgi:hypothetical protein